MYKLGLEQFLPFITTIVVVLLTDLLIGIGTGIAVAIFFILKKNFKNNYKYEVVSESNRRRHLIKLSEEVTFLNKASILELLNGIEEGSEVIIEGSHCEEIDHDAMEILKEFKDFGAPEKKIELTIIGLKLD